MKPTWDLVIEDMKKRDEMGRKEYGTPLFPHNGRDSLQDVYEELLDAAVYMKNLIIERDLAIDRLTPLIVRINEHNSEPVNKRIVSTTKEILKDILYPPPAVGTGPKE